MFATVFAGRRPNAARSTSRWLRSRRLRCQPPQERRLRVEPLEDRRLLAVSPLESLPALHSFTGAPASLYLDFNGDYEPAGGGYGESWTPVYDCDGDPTTFSDAELTNIQTIWAMVAEDFAPFNIDVTTVEPPVLADNVPRSDANGVALRVAIGGKSTDWYEAGYGGLSCVNSFTNGFANIAYVFPSSLVNITADSVSHEAGHSFGLQEQSEYDANGVMVAKYNPGDLYSWVPLMGATYYSTPVSTWYNGMNRLGVLQDDMAIIANSTNGFGCRSDDHGDTTGTATALAKVGNAWSGAGLIGTNSDVDAFSFTVTAADSYRIVANAAAVGPNLDAVLELRDSAGQVIASADPQTAQNAQLLESLVPGNYYLSVKSAGAYGWVGKYTLSIDTPPAGAIVTPISAAMTTGEDASQASFAVVLQRPPTADVIIGLSSSNATEGTVSPASLTFTASNWNTPQTVTVTGVDDAVVDGNQPYTIVTASAISLDPNYSDLDAADVALTNNDNDANIIIGTPSSLVTTEAGATTTFKVALATKPTAPVTITLSSSDTTEGTVSPASLTFTPTNYGTYQTVTATGVDDLQADGDVPYTILTAAAVSDDPRFNNVNAPDVILTNSDNETPGISVIAVSGRTTSETGVTAAFSVVLDTQPTANVTIALSSSDATEGTLSPVSVTFTRTNWNTPQIVTVTGIDDFVDDGNVAYTIVTVPATSADPNYNGLDAVDVVLSNIDNDTAGIAFTPVLSRMTTEAGGTATFSVVLNAQPTAPVTIGLTSGDTTEGTLSPASTTFTPTNWNTPQMVTVTGVNDKVVDGNVVYSIVTAPAISADPSYQGLNFADVAIVNLESGVPATPPTKFYVANDSVDKTYEYTAGGGAVESYNLNKANTAPRGAASTSAGSTIWVVDANRKVYVYNTSGKLLGSWSAGTLPSNATVEGIATNGTDVWIVDAYTDKVYCYSGAASRLSGSQNATSSFSLNSANTNPKDITTNGTYLWVVNDSTTDKVFRYTVAGSLVGSWSIDPANSSPTGLTIDPGNVSNIWIVDNGAKRVYQYNAAAYRNSGSQVASTYFALAAGNTNPQGIADPPAPGSMLPIQPPTLSASVSQAVGAAIVSLMDGQGKAGDAETTSRVSVKPTVDSSMSLPSPPCRTDAVVSAQAASTRPQVNFAECRGSVDDGAVDAALTELAADDLKIDFVVWSLAPSLA